MVLSTSEAADILGGHGRPWCDCWSKARFLARSRAHRRTASSASAATWSTATARGRPSSIARDGWQCPLTWCFLSDLA
jgi:hypothetical protein